MSESGCPGFKDLQDVILNGYDLGANFHPNIYIIYLHNKWRYYIL
jgi:hypothetical protein